MVRSKADLHTHTLHSFDGLSPVKEVVDAARRVGLSVLAITDHETIAGAQEAARYARRFGDLEIIIGEEINTGAGEILGLFLSEAIKPGLGMQETIDEIRRQQGLVLIPHPFMWITLKQTMTLRTLKKLVDKVDAIEVLNGAAGKTGKKEKRHRVNDKHLKLPGFGSSDAHHAKYIGCAYTIFPGRGAEDLREAILSGQIAPGGKHVSRRDDLFMVKEIVRRHGKKLKHYLTA